MTVAVYFCNFLDIQMTSIWNQSKMLYSSILVPVLMLKSTLG